MTYEFVKMNGLGNDFVIFDGRKTPFKFEAQELQKIADRIVGIGCDQILILEPPTNPQADVFMRIYNADGREAEACGNGTRCIAWLIAKDLKPAQIVIETVSGLRQARCTGDHEVAVDMGQASFEWDKIPLSREDNLYNFFDYGNKPTAVSIGNPHLVYFYKGGLALRIGK